MLYTVLICIRILNLCSSLSLVGKGGTAWFNLRTRVPRSVAIMFSVFVLTLNRMLRVLFSPCGHARPRSPCSMHLLCWFRRSLEFSGPRASAAPPSHHIFAWIEIRQREPEGVVKRLNIGTHQRR
jgi:hypothetical protein